jgi:hypothetical protein
MRRRVLWATAVIALLGGALLGAASLDHCGAWAPGGPQLTGLGRGTGPLRVGFGAAPLLEPWPVVVAGYGPGRHEARAARAPLFARATVLEAGGQRVRLVELDALLVPAALVERVTAGRTGPTLVVASHSHSAMGGFDRRPAAEVAGLGAFTQAAEDAWVKAAGQALDAAEAHLTPAQLELGEASPSGLNTPRSGSSADPRLTVARFVAGEQELGRWLIVAAHPTLVPQHGDEVDPDYPGRLGETTLVLQGAAGNASVARGPDEQPQSFAARLEAAAGATSLTSAPGAVPLAWAQVQVPLPRPDASRLVPGLLQPATENALCLNAETKLTLTALRVGPLTLLATPVEPSFAAGQVLEAASGASRVLGLTQGYEGYLEPVAVAAQGGGEAKRQYFPSNFITLLAEGAAMAGQAAGLAGGR